MCLMGKDIYTQMTIGALQVPDWRPIVVAGAAGESVQPVPQDARAGVACAPARLCH